MKRYRWRDQLHEQWASLRRANSLPTTDAMRRAPLATQSANYLEITAFILEATGGGGNQASHRQRILPLLHRIGVAGTQANCNPSAHFVATVPLPVWRADGIRRSEELRAGNDEMLLHPDPGDWLMIRRIRLEYSP